MRIDYKMREGAHWETANALRNLTSQSQLKKFKQIFFFFLLCPLKIGEEKEAGR